MPRLTGELERRAAAEARAKREANQPKDQLVRLLDAMRTAGCRPSTTNALGRIIARLEAWQNR